MTTWAYEVYVAGQPSDGVLAQIHDQIGEIVATQEPARTLITGSVPDQSALLGLLDQLHVLGLEVLELRHVVEPEIDGEILRVSPDPRSTSP